MKKRFLPLIMTLACIMACIFVFAACSDDPFKSKAWKMKSEEVTDKQWEEAFNEDNFKNVKVEITTVYDGQYEKEDGTSEYAKVTTKMTIIAVDDVWYIKSTAKVNKGSQELKDQSKEENQEGYLVKKSDGTYTTVHKEDGKWVKDTTNVNIAQIQLQRYLAYGEMAKLFHFVDAKSGYMIDSSKTIDMPWDVLMRFNGNRLKFKDGKLAGFFDDMSVTKTITEVDGDSTTTRTEDMARLYTMTLFTYGGQKLTVPKV